MTVQAELDPDTVQAAVIVTLGDAVDSTATLGGKAARLHELIGAGFPVPPAFCITTAGFDRFLVETGLADVVAPAEPGRALPGRELRRRVLETDIPEAIAGEILTAYADLGRPRVAVRSSAAKEDSATHSFAGQHDTLLDVAGDDALLAAVRECWASLWSDRADVYRGEGSAAGSIAVVVQQMIHSDVAGVLFTADPVGGRTDRLVVEACWGLGEGLVAGKVSSDFFLVDSHDLAVVEEKIRYKVTRCAAVAPGRIALVKVDAPARNTPCLAREQLTELAGLALRVREHYGADQDLEWVIRDGALHLLQARPITSVPPRTMPTSPYRSEQPAAVRDNTLWSRMDIGEIFTGIMSPLGQSFAQYYQRNVHGDCASATGVRDPGDVGLQMGYFQGHIYLNISYTAYMLTQCPPTRDERRFTSRFASEEADLTDYVNPFPVTRGAADEVRAATFWLRSAVTEMRRMRNRSEQMTSSRLYEFDRARQLDLTRMSRRELSAELARRLAYFHDMHVGYMPYYMNAFGYYGLLSELCAAWLGDAGDNLQNRVKTDMSSLRTVESAREIWRLAQAAKDRPEVLRIIRDSDLGEVSTRLLADADGRAFWAEFVDPFLRANGTRGRQEMELTHPRWIDDPSYVFQMIRRYADDDLSAEQILGRSRAHNEGDALQVLAQLPALKRRAIKRVISLYEQCSELREITRMAMITSIWLVRCVVYEVGRRLVDEGVLLSTDEVGLLDFEDVRAYLGGSADGVDVFPRSRIDEARRTFQYHRRLPEPPLTILGEHDVTTAVRPVADGARLDGLGASPGRIVGRARVIEDLVWQADEFQVGEILVTHFTDASWTPLFAIAGGVVTDIGSMLSHSSIVSREFNVPSVVNTKHATSRIATGDLVVVDGDAGTVEVVEG